MGFTMSAIELHRKEEDALMLKLKKKSINYFQFNDVDFHSNQKQFIINILKNQFFIEEKLKIKFNYHLEENYFNFLKNYEKN